VLSLHPRDRGELLHDILHDFFSLLQQKNLLPLAAQDRSILAHLLKEIAETQFQMFARSGTTGFALLWEIERERMLERLNGFLARECESTDDFLPAAFEAYFGAEDNQNGREGEKQFFPSGPVRFVLQDGEEISLHGRIDRIDLSADQQRARILDYKTGKPMRGRFAGGTMLQLPLYLFAARTLRPQQSWVCAEYAYVDRNIRPPGLLFPEDTWDDSLTTLRQIVTTLVAGIRSGCFFATPESCYPCPFPLICGAQAEVRAAHKHNDSRGAPLRRIKGIE
jgi:ATP-dependent helicase/DNAse subunit B